MGAARIWLLVSTLMGCLSSSVAFFSPVSPTLTSIRVGRDGICLRMAAGFGKVPEKKGSGSGKGKGKGEKAKAPPVPTLEEARKIAVMDEVQDIVNSVDDSKDPFYQLVPHIRECRAVLGACQDACFLHLR